MTKAVLEAPQKIDLKPKKARQWKENAIKKLLFLCAFLSVIVTAAIVTILFTEAYEFFSVVSITEFLTGTRWAPILRPQSFGVLPLFAGTLLIVLGSSLVALPVGLGSAIYLSEYAKQKTRRIIKPILEILAGIPTVVYGYFALSFVTPCLRTLFPTIDYFNALSASIVVGIMILPMVASLCDDALRAVPNSLRLAGYGLGATPMEVSTRIVVPAALSGVFASFVLAVSRAIGETMIVTLAAGATPNLTANPLQSIQTMTASIVDLVTGDIEHGTTNYQSLFAVGVLLFTMTLIMNVTANRILARFREEYE